MTGPELAALRDRQGVSLRELARALGRSGHSGLSRMEGRHGPLPALYLAEVGAAFHRLHEERGAELAASFPASAPKWCNQRQVSRDE